MVAGRLGRDDISDRLSVAKGDPDGAVLARIDPYKMKGLEIGPLHSPRVPKSAGQVRYLDHATRDELRDKYAADGDAGGQLDRIVDVDYVWTPGKRLAEIIGEWGPLDYVIAAHVIEHMPNVVDWLDQVSEVLKPGGVVSLVVPDKRFTFDAARSETTLAQVVDLHMRKVDKPTAAQVFDHESNYLGDVSAGRLWSGQDPSTLSRTDVPNPRRFAFEVCEKAAESGEYRDVHASTFTPESFARLLGGLTDLGMTDMAIAEIFPTVRGSSEFYTTLENVSHLEASARYSRQDVGLRRAATALAEADRPRPTGADSAGISDRARLAGADRLRPRSRPE